MQSELVGLRLWVLTFISVPNVETPLKYSIIAKTDSVLLAVGAIQSDGLKE
jgi:hypothetical protein